jgi:hypothetical protein
MDMLDFRNIWITSKKKLMMESEKSASFIHVSFISMSASSRQRILNVMGTFRPAFRSVAQSLTDIDLILVEEAFERLLLVRKKRKVIEREIAKALDSVY